MGTAANIWQGQILLVDDDPILLELGSAALSRAGFHVDVATDGQNALDLLSHLAYDLVITDLEMPRIGGLELIKRIRSNVATENLPVIVITGLDIACTLDSAYSAGATSFTTKPINWPSFAHHVRYVLRSSRQQDELRAVRNSIDSASRTFITTRMLSVPKRFCRDCNTLAQRYRQTGQGPRSLLHFESRTGNADKIERA